MELRRNITIALAVHLSPDGDAREQVRRATDALPAGANVRVETNGIKPISWNVPFQTQDQMNWLRPDLNFVFVTNENNFREWENLRATLSGGAK